MFVHGVSGKAKVICMMNQYSLTNQGLAQNKLTKTEELEFNQCVSKCCSYCNALQNFGLHSNFRAFLGLLICCFKHYRSFHEVS